MQQEVPENERKLRVLVQVNTSEEDSKSGIEPSKCADLVEHILINCDNLKFMGLMTIGKLGDPEAEKYFKRLVECKSTLLSSLKSKNINLGIPEEEFQLSMGMSGDFEAAIRNGSTNVRVGSTIFGARNYSKN